ncbi:Intein C-terminal splicing region [uncultured Caudovirales phage]|uniref:Intein C-terminal splicing region n=1 Tax=uncultured Caudovirales phage TaxID=2100421 RepID=A0A6J5M7S7_9CAUD|nr:Intein C-terminal splicing region [uncultured Caudovirales phage]
MIARIKTPSGIEKYSGIRKMKHTSYYKCLFTNGKTIECSPNHPFMTYDGIILAKDLSRRSEVYSEMGGVFLKSKNLIQKEIWLYDALETRNNTYYTNGILSHNCSFLGSSNTLISTSKLSTLAWVAPIRKVNDLDIYENPIEGHIYVISVDTSEGQNLDYSAFTVIDCTTSPYKLVAKYYNNKITPILYPSVIYNVARAYNNAHVLAETNSIGMQVVELLHKDLEYENIFSTTNMGRGGQRISAGFKKNSKLGIKMTHQIKSIGCANLKGMLESDKIIIQDFDLISELTSFVAAYNSYSAEAGCHDDLVMTMVLFSWLSTQQPFKEITDTNIRQKLVEEKMESMQEEILPFGIFDDGTSSQNFVDSEGNVWEEIKSESEGSYDSDGFFWKNYK